jgi:hypothetical protein
MPSFVWSRKKYGRRRAAFRRLLGMAAIHIKRQIAGLAQRLAQKMSRPAPQNSKMLFFFVAKRSLPTT